MRLKSLEIGYFRGATVPFKLEFNPDRKITMIFGENGNGKTTICDALIQLLSDDKGSLGDKSGVDQHYVKSMNVNKEAFIKLTSDQATFSGTIPLDTSKLKKSKTIQYPIVFAIRRKQIINLVEAAPADRYHALKDFLDIDRIIASEESLRKIIRDIDRDISNNVGIIHNSESQLEKTWIAHGKPDDTFEKWAQNQLLKNENSLQSDILKIENLINKWNRILNFHLQKAKKEKEIEVLKTEVIQSSDELLTFEQKNNLLPKDIIGLLNVAKDFISHQQTIHECPLCNKSNTKDILLQEIDNKLLSNIELKSAFEINEVKKNELSQSKSILSEIIANLNVEILDLSKLFYPFRTKYPQISEITELEPDDLNTNITVFERIKSDIEIVISKASKTLEDKKKEYYLLNEVKSDYQNIVNYRERVHKQQTLINRAKQALAIIETSRKDFCDKELSSISGDVNRMYEIIHPGEQLGNIALHLDPSKKGSLDLSAGFHEAAGITPQSIYSESHLDTLGICIYLALATKYGEGKAILVLDDLVNSVDETHLDRIIELLHGESNSFSQIIITTHYRPWKDRYTYHRAPHGLVQFYELRNWSREKGISIYNTKIILNELANYLSDDHFDRSSIASNAGKILENILDFLALKYECKLTYSIKRSYTLYELLSSFKSDQLKLMNVELYETDISSNIAFKRKEELKPYFEKFKQMTIVRNIVGAHYNPDGSLVSDNDVKEFGNTVLQFSRLLICPIFGDLPKKNDSGSFWTSRSGCIRLYPLSFPN